MPHSRSRKSSGKDSCKDSGKDSGNDSGNPKAIWIILCILSFVSSWLTFAYAHSESKIIFAVVDRAPVYSIAPAPADVHYPAVQKEMRADILAVFVLIGFFIFYCFLVLCIRSKLIRVIYKGISVMIQGAVATFLRTNFHWMLVYALFSTGVICQMRFFSLLFDDEKFLGVVNVILSLFIGNFLPLIYSHEPPAMIVVFIPLLAAIVALKPHWKRLILEFRREFLDKLGWGNQNTSGNGGGGRNSGGRGSPADI